MNKDVRTTILLNIMNIPNYYFLLFVDEEICFFNAMLAIFLFALTFAHIHVKDET